MTQTTVIALEDISVSPELFLVSIDANIVLHVPKNIVIPTKNQTPIALKAGQRVMLIKTPKGIYLRLRDQIVKIRVPNGLLPFGPIPNSERGCSPGSSRGSPSAAQNKTVAPPDVVTLHSSGEDD